VAAAANSMFNRPLSSDNLVPAHTHIVEKIVERQLSSAASPAPAGHAATQRPTSSMSRAMRAISPSGFTRMVRPGEIFIRMAKEGSTIGGLMDTIATLVSVSLQYGVPVESLVRKFEHVRFEPSGMTRQSGNPVRQEPGRLHLPLAGDGIRPRLQSRNAPHREPKTETPTPAAEAPRKSGNGHGPRLDPDTAQPFAYSEEELKAEKTRVPDAGHGSNLRLAIVADPLSQQKFGVAGRRPRVRCMWKHHRP